jgi:hypothetical protein
MIAEAARPEKRLYLIVTFRVVSRPPIAAAFGFCISATIESSWMRHEILIRPGPKGRKVGILPAVGIAKPRACGKERGQFAYNPTA